MLAPGTWLPWVVWGLAGVGGGILFFLTPGGMTVTLLFVGVACLMARSDRDRRFLLVLVFSAYALRLLLHVTRDLSITAVGGSYTLHGTPSFTYGGDHGYYTVRSLWLKDILLDRAVALVQWNEVTSARYGRSSHLLVLAAYYFLFGYSPVSSPSISACLSSLSGLLAHRIAGESYSLGAARAAGILVAFAPPLVAWSITNLKEPYLIFSALLILWFFLRWMNGGRIWHLLPIPLFLVFMGGTRDYSELIMLAVLAFASLYIAPPACFRLVTVTASLLAALIGVLFFGLIVGARVWELLYGLLRLTHGQSNAGGFSYRLLPDHYYLLPGTDQVFSNLRLPEFGVMFAKGWAYFLLAPFPWATASLGQLTVYPWMLIWYGLLTLAFLGLILALASNSRPTLVLMIYVLFMGSAIALSSGNIGTVFRHRDLVSPVLLIFSGVALGRVLTGPSKTIT